MWRGTAGVGRRAEKFECVAVIAGEARARPEPQESLFILRDARKADGRRSLDLRREALESEEPAGENIWVNEDVRQHEDAREKAEGPLDRHQGFMITPLPGDVKTAGPGGPDSAGLRGNEQLSPVSLLPG